jgi:hypothetical protein
MEPFKDLDAARGFLEQRIYDHFRAMAEWPRARDFDLEYYELLDPLGGLEVVCRQIGVERLSCGSPVGEHDRVALRLRALAECEGAEDDVAHFLAAVRFGADRYHASQGREVQLSIRQVVEHLGIDELAGRRVLELLLSGNGVVQGGSAAAVTFTHLVSRMRGVKALEDYLARVSAHDERLLAVAKQAAGRALRRTSRPAQRIFLSHAADDAALAHHLANVLRQGADQLDVFVASKAGDIPTGADWLDTIEAELRRADTYVLLLTPRSVERFWLWYESGAAWMTERPFIPLTAAGLSKGQVPYPLGARQALSLEDPSDVEQMARDLGIAIADPEAFCATVLELSKALPHAASTPFRGIVFANRFFDWDGPLHKLDERAPTPELAGLPSALKAAGAEPIFGLTRGVRQQLARGYLPVYETDRKTWKREILHVQDGDQILFVRPPAEASPKS